jgi:DNA-binding transcriptional MerR regulator
MDDGTTTSSGVSVQEAAERTGLSAHTLRYYERAGLLLRVGRQGSGAHRRYSEDDLRFLAFLKRLRATGMPIREMRRYAALVRAGDATLEERRHMLEERRDETRRQLRELQQSLDAIEWKIENYRRLGLEKIDGPGAECGIGKDIK